MPDMKSICTELLRLDAEATGGGTNIRSTSIPGFSLVEWGENHKLEWAKYSLQMPTNDAKFFAFSRHNAPAIARRCLELEAENERLKGDVTKAQRGTLTLDLYEGPLTKRGEIHGSTLQADKFGDLKGAK